jgi:hypothetical protein
MDFLAWLEQQGCTVEITQDADESGGYVCAEVRLPGGTEVTEISVTV